MGRLIASTAFVVVLGAACCPDDPPVGRVDYPAQRHHEPRGGCADTPIAGQRALMTIAPHAASGPDVDPPEECSVPGRDAGFYVRVHGHGRRKLAYDRRPGACDVVDADPERCPTISIHAFSKAVFDAMRARIGEANTDGLGLGVCGRMGGSLEMWNMSSRVHDWAYVDESLRAIDEELRRWDVDGDYGLSITAIPCVMVELD